MKTNLIYKIYNSTNNIVEDSKFTTLHAVKKWLWDNRNNYCNESIEIFTIDLDTNERETVAKYEDLPAYTTPII